MKRSLVGGGSLIGASALLAAIAVATLEPSGSQLAVVGTDWAVFAVASAAITLGLVGLFRASRASDPASADETMPERSREPTRRHRRATEAIDRALERPELGESTTEFGRRTYRRRKANRAVREAISASLAARHDVSEADATRRINEGSWTDDPRAAAFAGANVSLPLRYRLEDWAHGARYQRGLEAAIGELEALVDADATEAPATSSEGSGPGATSPRSARLPAEVRR